MHILYFVAMEVYRGGNPQAVPVTDKSCSLTM